MNKEVNVTCHTDSSSDLRTFCKNNVDLCILVCDITDKKIYCRHHHKWLKLYEKINILYPYHMSLFLT